LLWCRAAGYGAAWLPVLGVALWGERFQPILVQFQEKGEPLPPQEWLLAFMQSGAFLLGLTVLAAATILFSEVAVA
jgi:hypothetical protein